jgi:hypothetical protein
MQPDLFTHAPRFDGPDLQPADQVRLTAQQQRLLAYMGDGRWHTLRAISEATGIPEASASAQCRNLRKVRFGSHTVERRHLGGGLYQYRVVSREA